MAIELLPLTVPEVRHLLFALRLAAATLRHEHSALVGLASPSPSPRQTRPHPSSSAPLVSATVVLGQLTQMEMGNQPSYRHH